MRSGACTVQQTLTTEAASVLKHSLSLARRRGHAQVTPLHVAATLLMSSRASLLRRACLKSQPPSYQTTPHHNPHIAPLQCRALELCFNVALNRLPTTPGPLLHVQPSLSNALIAALKRAQAHQRRGCIESQQQQQQQPLLAIKVELEQLILSILDDPSVSRVMREAGFSSTAVKTNLEDTSNFLTSSPHVFFSGSGGVYSSPSSPNSYNEHAHHGNFWQTHFKAYPSEQNPLFVSPQKKVSSPDSSSLKEDINMVIEVLMGKKRSKNTIIVGDSVSLTEGLVLEIMAKVERGDVPEELISAHFIKFQFSSVPLRFMKREEVEMNLSDLKKKVDSLSGGARGVIIYAGDLKWTVDEKEGGGLCSNNNGYSPVDHLVVEIGRMISEYSSSSQKIWLMGTANYQTYMKCKMKQPSLELQWALQAVSVPSGGLGLSLNATSVHESRINSSQYPSQLMEKKPFTSKDEANILTCCPECASNYDKEAALFNSGTTKNLDKLPYWLQSQGPDSLQKDDLAELRIKWNRLCQSFHQARNNQNSYMRSSVVNNHGLIGKGCSYTSPYPLWPANQNNSISFADSTLKPSRGACSFPRFRRQQSCHIEFSFSNGNSKDQVGEANLDSLKSREGKEVKITLALGNSLSLDHGKVAESEDEEERCKCLLDNVPWQSETIPSIVEVLINSKSEKKDTWLLIEGNDAIGKRRLGLAIAETVFGSAGNFLCMSMRKTENMLSQRCEVLERALRNQENLVVLVEGVDYADPEFLKYLGDGYESGNFCGNGRAIFILTKGDHYNDKPNPVIQMKLQISETNSTLGTLPKTDHHKRMAESDLSSKCKVPRISEKDPVDVSIAIGNGQIKKDLSRQSSLNSLDLNIMADDCDDNNEDEECSPNSSDLTRETDTNPPSAFGFLERIKARFVFNQSSSQERLMREILLSKIKGSFKEVFGSEDFRHLTVESVVLEEVVFGVGLYLDSLFEKWLKEVFQTSLLTVKIGGKEGMGFRLCMGVGDTEKENGVGIQEGFMGSNLPKEIKVCFMY